MPSEETVARALELVARGPAQYDYFFDNLEDPSWIEPLLAQGFFTSPTPPMVSGEGTMHPYWSESRYLLRMATRAPDAVAAAVRAIPPTENVRVLTDICEIGASLSGTLRLEVGKRVRAETRGAPIFFLLPQAMGELIVAIANAGEAKFALHFAAELLELHIPESEGPLPPRPSGRVDAYEYGQLATTLIPKLAALGGFGALDLGVDLLEQTIDGRGERTKPRDFSDYWRAAIEDESRRGGSDVTDGLVAATREAALAVIDGGRSDPSAVVERLRARGWHIFTRIALYVAAQRAGAMDSVDVELALDPALLTEAPLDRERDQLLAAVGADLDAGQIEGYLARVAEGNGIPATDDTERDQQRFELWQRDRLAPLAGLLPAAWKAKFEDLTERYGNPQPGLTRATAAYWSGPTSPVGEPEMADMEASAVIDFVAGWAPDQSLRSPSAEGLARVLRERVKSSPREFGGMIERIRTLDPTYVRAVIGGMEAAAKEGEAPPWPEALGLIEVAVEAPRLEEAAERRERDDRDPDWRWARKEAAGLIEVVFQNDLLPADLAERAWESLRSLSWDAEPDASYERRFGGTNMDPLTLSLNTTRGEAMHAVVAFAIWASEKGDEANLARALGNLDEHLDPISEPSQTVRGVFGARLHQLHLIAPEWVGERVPRLFPARGDLEVLREAAWDTYVMWGRPSPTLFDVLKEEYRTAVEELPVEARRAETARRDPAEALAEHLATFLWWGTIGTTSDGLAAEFFRRARAPQAAHLIEVLGRSLGDDQNQPISAEVLARIETLWAALDGWIEERSREERLEILAAFGDLYASGVFDEDWSDSELLRLAEDGVLAGAEYVVFDRLVARAAVAPATPLRFALALVESPPKPWTIDAHREDLGAIIEIGLAGPERGHAEQLVNRLVAKGHRGFRDYLAGEREE